MAETKCEGDLQIYQWTKDIYLTEDVKPCVAISMLRLIVMSIQPLVTKQYTHGLG